MSHRNNTVVLSAESIRKISYALYIIKDVEQSTKSVVFQNNVGILNFGGSSANISLPANLPIQLISTIDLNNLYSKIDNLKVNNAKFQMSISLNVC
jgi:hypothetical protein